MSGWACVCVRLGFTVVSVSMYSYECGGEEKWGLGVGLCGWASVCVEDKDLANRPGLADR